MHKLSFYLPGSEGACMSVKHIKFSPSTYVLHMENRILFMYEISSL